MVSNQKVSGQMSAMKILKFKWAGLLILLSILITSSFVFSSPAPVATDSRYDSGLNLPFNEKAGNVNPQSGNLTIEATDLELPGRGGFNFKFGRIWNLNQSNVFTMSRNPYDGSNQLNSETMERFNRIGVGWSRNIPYIFKDNSSGVQVINLCFNGSVYELDQSGLALYKSGINPDKSNILGYDLLDLRVYQEAGVNYGAFSGLANLPPEYGVTDQADTQNEYVLILKDNSRYWFRSDGRLMMQSDRTGMNQIWYFYNNDLQLKLVVDSAGRRIRFNYDSNGNLATIQWDVERGVKRSNGLRERETVTYSITFQYESAETLSGISSIKPTVSGYQQPFMLTSVTDPEGNITRYGYSDGQAYFTYDSFTSRSQNVYLLLKEIVSMARADGKYKNKQCFEYDIPAQGLYSKKFYQGYIEYYKVSRQYNQDRSGRVMNDTTYLYFDQGQAGNVSQYTAVIQQGNVKTTYIYSISGDKAQDNVLDKLLTETRDGFREERDFVYNANRAKILEEVYRGQFVYREKFDYDLKGNLKRYEDKAGLVTVTEYDDIYSIPLHVVKKLEVDGRPKEYETESIINVMGLVEKEILYLEQADGSKRAVVSAQNQYDAYGNLIKVTDAKGNIIRTVYDATRVFPIKVYQDVTVASWQNGGIVGDNWFNEPDGTRMIRVRNWKVFNSDGSVWLEIDNEGYAVEHYYDKNGSEVETVAPDGDDFNDFVESVTVTGVQTSGNDFNDFLTSPGYGAFLASRQNNPRTRSEINYTEDFVKTFTDIDSQTNAVKATGQQSDGLGHVEEEIEYDGSGNRYAVKRMTYDLEGRRVGLTDPDAGATSYFYPVNGVRVARYDKTWITEYDDLGRQKWVLYPETESGRTDSKRFVYNDVENSITITDPMGRKSYEKRDWNGNLIQAVNYGDTDTKSDDCQVTNYTYDKLNRLIKMVDPKGIITTYRYDERDRILEQNYGTSGSETMEYDDLGLLTRKTDRMGQIQVLQYDEMKRATSVKHYKSNADYQNGAICRQVETVFDNRGNAVRVDSDTLIEYYTYDHNNRVIKLERRLKDPNLRQQVAAVWGGDPAAQKFGFNYQYNDGGMITRMVYPDGSIHQYQYDSALARLQKLDATQTTSELMPFITGFQYTGSGMLARMDYANQTRQTWSFDNRKRIAKIGITGPNGVLEDLNYKLNADGDVLSINENEYTYDGFDRISGAKTILPNRVDQKKLIAQYFGTYNGGDPINGLSYQPEVDLNNDGRINGDDQAIASLLSDDANYDIESFQYDKNGNRTQLVQNGDTYTYQYGDRNRLEAVYQKKKDATSAQLYLKFEYDRNGNTTARTIYTATGEVRTSFEYDTLGRVIKTTQGGKTSEYLYDSAGNRFLKKGTDGITLYLRHGQTVVAMDIEIPGSDPVEKGKINRYVLSGDLLAGRFTRTIKRDGTSTLSTSYYHLDHLNSTKCISDSNGQVDVRYIYRAFGSELAKLGTGDAKYTYNGKEFDKETNLYYFGARYYDAETGRFISEDPAKEGLNWYVYCANNPLKFADPTGLAKKSQTDNVLDWVQTGLDVAGLVPGFGEIADGANALISLARGDYVGAALSAAAMIPIGGQGATATKFALKYGDEVVAGGKQLIKHEDDLVRSGKKVADNLSGGICFTADTPILTKLGYKLIKNIQVNDEVYSENPETGEKGLKKVVRTFVNETSALIHIFISGTEIKATPEHPFWVMGKGWIRAGELKQNDQLLFYSGEIGLVSSIRTEKLLQPIKVYNFEVEDWHTYFVSERNILVHNTCQAPKPKDTGSYTITFEKGQKYHGKGPESRANQSAKIKSEKYDNPVVDIDWTKSKNEREAFKDEYQRLKNDGGYKNPNNYNQRESPGKKYYEQDNK
ncbi:MAG TPA: polymorphic toxin-type HINT domain-containing protein [Bacillota bacterium]|nr:polymorphic toxin-type HINT domain-containing protein [Bacillota bacterium]